MQILIPMINWIIVPLFNLIKMQNNGKASQSILSCNLIDNFRIGVHYKVCILDHS